MPYVQIIPAAKVVMIWIWSFSSNVSMKNILKLIYFIYLILFFLALH